MKTLNNYLSGNKIYYLDKKTLVLNDIRVGSDSEPILIKFFPKSLKYVVRFVIKRNLAFVNINIIYSGEF